MSEYRPTDAIQAQERYCEEHETPLFAPYDGICPNCGHNIYLRRNIYPLSDCFTGIPVSVAGSRIITGCPHCSYSFVE